MMNTFKPLHSAHFVNLSDGMHLLADFTADLGASLTLHEDLDS
jgi:hypothetical protein